jgi:hypothetical protein
VENEDGVAINVALDAGAVDACGVIRTDEYTVILVDEAPACIYIVEELPTLLVMYSDMLRVGLIVTFKLLLVPITVDEEFGLIRSRYSNMTSASPQIS